MKKVYYLSTCDTCSRILKELDDGFQLQDIKYEKITAEQLDQMRLLGGSYESLFSRVARKYKELGLKDKNLSEEDYKNYILNEYTFLKRPVFIINDRIFVGNSKKNIEGLSNYLKTIE
ncbi:MAG: ArsC/Spx/MgsR family protein [Bacteroidota bacterium]